MKDENGLFIDKIKEKLVLSEDFKDSSESD